VLTALAIVKYISCIFSWKEHMPNLASILAKNLSRILEEKGISQKELAKRSGLAVQTVHNYANGKNKDIRNESLIILARALDVAVTDLMKEEIPETGFLTSAQVYELVGDIPSEILFLLSKGKKDERVLAAIRALLVGYASGG
jgi:transcriptional regulator with XRE-family HTH domain